MKKIFCFIFLVLAAALFFLTTEEESFVKAEVILNSPQVCKYPRAHKLIDEWLNVAVPAIQKQEEGNWHYDQWGRAYNNTTVIKSPQPPDTPLERYQYLWEISTQLHSVAHETLREYVEKMLR